MMANRECMDEQRASGRQHPTPLQMHWRLASTLDRSDWEGERVHDGRDRRIQGQPHVAPRETG